MKPILNSHQFQPKNHDFLQQLWLDAHYEQWEKKNGRKINSVGKHRIRRRNPFPMTISDGEEKIYGFKVQIRIVSYKYGMFIFTSTPSIIDSYFYS